MVILVGSFALRVAMMGTTVGTVIGVIGMKDVVTHLIPVEAARGVVTRGVEIQGGLTEAAVRGVVIWTVVTVAPDQAAVVVTRGVMMWGVVIGAVVMEVAPLHAAVGSVAASCSLVEPSVRGKEMESRSLD